MKLAGKDFPEGGFSVNVAAQVKPTARVVGMSLHYATG